MAVELAIANKDVHQESPFFKFLSHQFKNQLTSLEGRKKGITLKKKEERSTSGQDIWGGFETSNRVGWRRPSASAVMTAKTKKKNSRPRGDRWLG